MSIIGDEIQEIIDSIKLPPVEDTDITINRLCAETNLKSNAMRVRMKQLVDAGIWKIIYKRGINGSKVQTFTKV